MTTLATLGGKYRLWPIAGLAHLDTEKSPWCGSSLVCLKRKRRAQKRRSR